MASLLVEARRGARPLTPGLLRGPDHPGVARALATTGIGIGIALAGRRLYESLTAPRVEAADSVRYALGTTLVTYLLVGIVLVLVVRRLDWDVTPAGLALGLGLGTGLALVLLRGDVAGADPRLAVLVSEGSLVNVAATVLIGAVAAPLCEEVLFRGVLLESMERHSPRLAVWTSGVAFAVWHLSPSSLLYYTLFGALFGGLYLNRGLACSVAAHAAFNGVLVASAVSLAFGPGATLTVSGLVVTAPSGWHVSDDGRHLDGPSGADLYAWTWEVGELDSEHAIESLLASDGRGGYRVRPQTARIDQFPIGEVVRVGATWRGRDGELAMLAANGRMYVISYTSAGSAKARADFDKMLRDLRLAS